MSDIYPDPRVMITSGTQDLVNRNARMRDYVAEGFVEILGRERVMNLPLEVTSLRINEWKPHLVLVFGSCLPDYCDYSELEYACDKSGSVLSFWLHDDPYEFDGNAKILNIADYIFTNDQWAAEHYHRKNVWHLPMAASPTAHQSTREDPEGAKRRDVFFCGVGFNNRRRILRDLSETLNKVHTEIFGDEWNVAELPFCHNQRIPNDQMKDYYATSRIVLNLSRDFDYANKKYQLVASTPGPRTFEAAMAGACQVMFVDSLEILDCFIPGEEIVLFNDPDEFAKVIEDLLSAPEKRRRIGAAAQRRCLRDHTYAARARTLLERVGVLRKETIAL